MDCVGVTVTVISWARREERRALKNRIIKKYRRLLQAI
jgi:hypothetical protein